MKIVTLDEAIASGKPFRSCHTSPGGHKDSTGHIWRLFDSLRPEFVGKKTPTGFEVSRPETIKCVDCGESLTPLVKGDLDEWVVWQDDTELDKEAEDILNKLGIKITDKVPA